MIRAPVALLGARGLLAGALGGAAAQQNAAASWPSKPIHAVVPLAPGTGGDVMARLMTPAEFDALIKKEIADNAVLAKAAGLKPN
jgi:tripartite-type tricarboxylate transporter receptor subunit TctC